MQTNNHEITTPLLITSAIHPPEGVPFLRMSEPIQRLLAARAFVFLWASGCRVRNLVICDATGQWLLDKQEMQVLVNLGINVEQLAFQQNTNEIRRFGKGYGEGKIIEHAVLHSKIIAQAGAFYKCTAKIFVKNIVDIDQLIKKSNCKSFFYRQPMNELDDFSFVDTRFFYNTVDFFNEIVLHGYAKSNDFIGLIAEKSVFNAILPVSKRALFAKPEIFGLCGGTAHFYPELSFGSYDLKFPCLVAW